MNPVEASASSAEKFSKPQPIYLPLITLTAFPLKK